MASISGLNRTLIYLERVSEQKKDEVFDYLEQAGARMEAEAKLQAPVDTGRLRQSIQHNTTRTPKKIKIVVYTNIEYAIYVEYGTRYMAAQPFMRPTYAKYKGKIHTDARRIARGG